MRITAIETLRVDEWPNLIWVQIHTDAGVVGLGETYKGVLAVEAYIHETAAAALLGADPLRIDLLDATLQRFQFAPMGIGAEVRGNSALNIALWDLFGKVTGQPVYQLLGGRTHERIPVYNTCAGPLYQRRQPQQSVANYGLPSGAADRYDDLFAFLNRADELAEDLLAEGFTAMKIWPFDRYAEKSRGSAISAAELKQGLEPFEKIRARVGDRMEIMVEFHALWDLPTATMLAREIEPFKPYWYEDPILMNNVDALREYAVRTPVRVTASERIAGRSGFREILEKRAASVIMFDVGWNGGLSESKRIATMAEAYQLPVAPHDCTGPLLWMASAHLAMNVPNALNQECVRAFFTTWYPRILTELPAVRDGYLTLSDRPGLGTELRPELLKRSDLTVRRSAV